MDQTLADDTDVEATASDGPPTAENPSAGEQRPSSDELVLLDELGTPRTPWDGEPAVVRCVGLPDAALRRLAESGDYVLEQGTEASAALDAVVVSTRLPRREALDEVTRTRSSGAVPLIALVHAGGEDLALELMRAGATVVVAEGNEAAVRAATVGAAHDDTLVEVHERRYAPAREHAEQGRQRDRVTGLPTREVFLRRLEELGAVGDVPRLALMRVLRLDPALRRLSPAAGELLIRRLGLQLTQAVAGHDTELYALSPAEYALISDEITPNQMLTLGKRLARLVEGYAPTDGMPLALAVGHAGPEAAADAVSLRDLAVRALAVAAVEPEGAVVGADTLSLRLSAGTELETALRVVDSVERQAGGRPGHGLRVAAAAVAALRVLGESRRTLSQARLAAHLHEVGKASLPPEAHHGPDGLDDETRELWRSHAERGEAYVRVSAGDEVAAGVRGHHERWDGSGFPDGLSGPDIPLLARAVALGDAWDRGREAAGDAEAAYAAVQALAGTVLDPRLVEALGEALEELEAEAAQPDSSVNMPGLAPSTSMR